MAIWNDPSPYTEYNDLIKQYEEFQTKLANGQSSCEKIAAAFDQRTKKGNLARRTTP
tara:strand:+ start:952 stop:1122 length:171 start_codon:yes stop_codon:yes gene_type:complete